MVDSPRSIALLALSAPVEERLAGWLVASGYLTERYVMAEALLDEGAELFAAVCVGDAEGSERAQLLLRRLKAADLELPVLLISAAPAVTGAVAAIRSGADDYLDAEATQERFLGAIAAAAAARRVALRARARRDCRHIPDLIGETAAIRALTRHVRRVADSSIAVALIGETGTGKELVASCIHRTGHRGRGPFVAINCAAIPASLQEAELFGHERGAFTGATSSRPGSFEQAHQGTLLLDEVGETSPSTQTVLLRALQERTVRRVGGTTEIPVDVRIISATSRDLEEDVREGRFRKDLYYRLVVYPIHLQPLRERRPDIPHLVAHIVRQQRAELGVRAERLHPEALEALMRYDWPGNVRELQNVVSRAMVVCDGSEVHLSHLPPELVARAVHELSPGDAPPPSDDAQSPGSRRVTPLRELERREILRALRLTGGNVAQAARLLEISRATLYRRIAAEGIALDDARTLPAPSDPRH